MKRFVSILVLMTVSLMAVQNSFAQKHTDGKLIKEIEYLQYLPEGYSDNEDSPWPLLVFLHGAGERGSDLEKLKLHGPPKLIEQGKDFPFIIISPQTPLNSWWRGETVAWIIQEIVQELNVDKSRIYLTGLSMGGFGTWDTAMRFPHLFAAIAPICGGGDVSMVHNLKNMPVWNFHGEKDNVVKIESSDLLVNKLKETNTDVKYTIYPEAFHDSWTVTYENEELYEWLLSHSKE